MISFKTQTNVVIVVFYFLTKSKLRKKWVEVLVRLNRKKNKTKKLDLSDKELKIVVYDEVI